MARDIVGAIEGHEQKVFCFNHEKGDSSDVVDGTEIVRAGCFAKIASSEPVRRTFVIENIKEISELQTCFILASRYN